MGVSIAKFPCVRTLWPSSTTRKPSVDPKQILELATSRWVVNGDSMLLLGPSGVRKMHLAVALGREAIVRGYSTLFVPHGPKPKLIDQPGVSSGCRLTCPERVLEPPLLVAVLPDFP